MDEKTMELETPQVEDNTSEYIAKINELKQNSVSKSQYDKLKAENKQLLDSLCNGTSFGQAQPQKVLRDYNEIGKELATADFLTAKEFLALSEEFREAMIQQKGVDPWMYKGSSDHVEYTQEDYDNLEAIEMFVDHMHTFDDADKEHYVAEINRLTPRISNKNNNLRKR